MTYTNNYKKFDIEDIWLSKIRNNNSSSSNNEKKFRNVHMYLNPSKYERIAFKTPFFTITFKVSEFSENNKKKYKLTIDLFPLVEKRKQFKDVINDIDDEIEETVGNMLNDNYVFNRTIKKNNMNYKMTLTFPYDKDNEALYKIVNKNNEPCLLTDIKPKMRGMAYIESSDIWIDDEKEKYGYNWNVVQLKIYPEIIINEYSFIDEISNNSTSTINFEKTTKKKCKLTCPKCDNKIDLNININMPTLSHGILHGSSHHHSSSYIPSYQSNDIPIPPPLDNIPDSNIKPFVPNLDELLLMKKKLKPAITKESNVISGKVLDNSSDDEEDNEDDEEEEEDDDEKNNRKKKPIKKKEKIIKL